MLIVGQLEGADMEDVAIFEQVLTAHAHAVDEGPIAAAVAEDVTLSCAPHFGVIA
jgi:hypothetical protein